MRLRSLLDSPRGWGLGGILVALGQPCLDEQLPKPPNPPEYPSIPLKAFDLPGVVLARELELDLWILFQFPALVARV